MALSAKRTGNFMARRRLSALKFLCSCLSSSSGEELETRLNSTGDVTAFQWAEFIYLATDHLVAPAVAHRFDRCGLTGGLPDLVERYFDAALQLNRKRNGQLRDQAIEVAGALNEINVTPVILKGGAGLFSGLYEEPGIRTMSDLDILVPSDRGGDCLSKLAAWGYNPAKSDDHPRMHTFASLAGPSGKAPVDLHREALAYPYEAILPVEDVVTQATTHVLDGVRLATPSPTHQIIHNVAHAQLNDHAYVYGHLPLKALHDFVLLSQRFGDNIDWSLVENSFCAMGRRAALVFHCLAVQDLLHAKLDIDFSPSLSQRALLWRARVMIDYPTLQRISDRFVRVFLLFGREFSDAELRSRLARNMRRPDWWQRHLGFFWQGGR